MIQMYTFLSPYSTPSLPPLTRNVHRAAERHTAFPRPTALPQGPHTAVPPNLHPRPSAPTNPSSRRENVSPPHSAAAIASQLITPQTLTPVSLYLLHKRAGSESMDHPPARRGPTRQLAYNPQPSPTHPCPAQSLSLKARARPCLPIPAHAPQRPSAHRPRGLVQPAARHRRKAVEPSQVASRPTPLPFDAEHHH